MTGWFSNLVRSRRGKVGAAVLVFAVAAAILPPVQARAKAVFVLAEALGVKLPRPFAPDVTSEDTTIGGTAGRLYSPGSAAPPVLLVPGATPEGPDDERVIRLARALARADRLVFVPQLELSERKFVKEDVERLVYAVEGLAQHDHARGPVAIIGFSYGGSFSLLAAADQRISADVELVALFGAYFDLGGVVQAATTGRSLVGETEIEWSERHPDAGDILREVAPRLVGKHQRAELVRALEGSLRPSKLDAPAARVYELMTNEDPAATPDLIARLPARAGAVIADFSPSTVADRVEAPVIALHSTDDPVVPYAELLRLREGLPEARTVSVELFDHVDFESGGDWVSAADDLFMSWRFTSWLLAAQE